MMDAAKSKTFKKFTILNKALRILIKLNGTVVQSVPLSIRTANGTVFRVVFVDRLSPYGTTSSQVYTEFASF